MLKWLVTVCALSFALYQGGVNRIEGYANALQFLIWLCFGISLFTLSDKVREKQRSVPRGPVPLWVKHWFCAVFTLGLAWFAWFWTAAAFAIACLLLYSAQTPTTPEGDKP